MINKRWLMILGLSFILCSSGYSENQMSQEELNNHLRVSVQSGNVQSAEALIKQGADVNAVERGVENLTLLETATDYGNYEMVKMLVAQGAVMESKEYEPWPLLKRAAVSGNKEIVKLYLDKGLDPNVKDACGDTALICAAYNNHPEVVKLLWEREGRGDEGRCPTLVWCAAAGLKDQVKRELKPNVNVNVKSIWGMTALMWAANNGHQEIVKLLTARGAQVNLKCGERTALQMARQNGHKEIVLMLKKAGAK